MEKHQRRSFSSLCKRKQNKIPLNLLSASKGVKRSKCKIIKEVVEVDLPQSSHAPSTDPAWSCNEVDEYQEDDTMVTPVSAHTKRKQKLAEKWNTLRNGAYRVMIEAHAMHYNQN